MINRVLQYLEINFGIPQSVFRKYNFVVQKDKIFLTTKTVNTFNKLKPFRKGILFAQQLGKTIKISNSAIQIFGKYAKINTIELSSEQMQEFMKTKTLSLNKISNISSQKPLIFIYKNFPVAIY